MRFFDRRWAISILLTFAVGCSSMGAKEAMSPPMAEPSPAPMPPPPPGAAVPADVATGNLLAREIGGQSGNASAKAPPPAPKNPTPAQPQTQGAEGQPVQKQQSIIIYSAQLNMAVFEVETSMKRIEALAKSMGGFLAKREDMTIVVRVPADRFDDALHDVEKIGDMLHRNISAEDVTEEFRDLEVRLKASKAVQERLTQLLSKATKVEESIAIERELDRITMEIDRIEGRIKFLRDRAAFSTLTITFQPKSTENVSQGAFKMPTPWLNELGLGKLFQL
jgi:hypothetical protein